jgi:hypothetical protein
VVKIRKIPAPDTAAGLKFARYMPGLAGEPLREMAEEERRIRRLPQNITLLQSIRGLNHLQLTLLFSAHDMGDGIMRPVPELAEPRTSWRPSGTPLRARSFVPSGASGHRKLARCRNERPDGGAGTVSSPVFSWVLAAVAASFDLPRESNGALLD